MIQVYVLHLCIGYSYEGSFFNRSLLISQRHELQNLLSFPSLFKNRNGVMLYAWSIGYSIFERLTSQSRHDNCEVWWTLKDHRLNSFKRYPGWVGHNWVPSFVLLMKQFRYTWGPFLPTWINFNLVCISNHIASKMWDAIAYPSLDFNVAIIEVWEWISNFIPNDIMDVVTYLW